MLDPELKYVFDCSKLQKGDILLMDTYHDKQRRFMPNDKYLHVAVYIGNAMIVEADGLGSAINHLYSYAFKRKEDACVVRVKGINPLVADKLQRCLREDLGREYGTREAFKVNQLKHTSDKDTSKLTFCSRNVAKAFEKCSINLVPNPDYCSPDDLMTSDVVDVVDDAICEIENDIRDIIASHIDKRENVDVNILPQVLFEKVRQFFKSKGLTSPEYNIQNYSEMVIAILKAPEYDHELAQLLSNHQYLINPKINTQKYWPWFNDDEEFFKHYTITAEALFFIYNQIDHYDGLYLPTQRENFTSVTFLSILRNDSESLKVLARHWKAIYAESIRIRKRIAVLYHKILSRDPRGAYLFQQVVGYPKRIEFEYPVLDISKFLFMYEAQAQKIREYIEKHPQTLSPDV